MSVAEGLKNVSEPHCNLTLRKSNERNIHLGLLIQKIIHYLLFW